CRPAGRRSVWPSGKTDNLRGKNRPQAHTALTGAGRDCGWPIRAEAPGVPATEPVQAPGVPTPAWPAEPGRTPYATAPVSSEASERAPDAPPHGWSAPPPASAV